MDESNPDPNVAPDPFGPAALDGPTSETLAAAPPLTWDHAPSSPANDPHEAAGWARWTTLGREILSGAPTLMSAAVYATLIVTFGFQVARVDGLSMAPTLEDHDRLIVNKLVYELGDPRPGDIVM